MKIMVDLDRVVFDCPSFTFWIGNIFCTKRYEDKELSYHLINEEEAKTYKNNLFFLKMSHAKNFTQVDISVEVLRKWAEQGFEINFVSSRPKFKAFQKATVEWLNANNIKYNSLIFSCSNKPEYCKINNFDIIIDDTLENCKGAAEYGMFPIWVRTKYNRDIVDFPENVLDVEDWSEIDMLVQSYTEYQQSKIVQSSTSID